MNKVIINLKTRYKRMFMPVVAILLIALATSCGKKNDTEEDNSNKEINEWILEMMKVYYLWNTHIPGKTDQTLSPDEYFESLLYRPSDRFSWIQDNFVELLNSLSGVNTEAGYDYNLLRMSENNSNVIGYITYIKPGTPAGSAGLKRGDFFHEINGIQMDLDNYSSLLKQTLKPHTLGLSVISGNTLTGVKNVQLGVIENYAENPILLDTVYHIAGKNIGYFVYNFFARDRGNGNLAYEIELNDLFYDFKSKHLDELIVDLRYNGGGAVVTASVLAEMISGRPASDVFYQQEYNSFLNEYLRTNIPNYTDKSYFLNKIESSDGRTSIPVNSLSNLSTVYFIVSGRSASASELLINGLKPYMNVVLIGEKTYGKNVASITIYEEDPVKQRTNKWGMQPIIMKMSNAQGFSEYGEGFVPDVRAFEFSGQDFDIKQLGDTDELLLKAAINTVSGIKTPTAVTKRTGRQFELVGSAVDRTPARRNQYISLENMELTGK